MSEPVLELDLGDQGGVHVLRSYAEAISWAETERDRWRWLDDPTAQDRFGGWQHVTRRFGWLTNQLQSARDQGQPFENQAHLFAAIFKNQEIVLHSEGDQGRRVLDIREIAGPKAAAMAFGLATRRQSFGEARDPLEIAGAIYLAVPGLAPIDTIAARLQRERRNLRDRTERLVQGLTDDRNERQLEFRADRAAGRKLAVRWAKRRFAKWKSDFENGISEGERFLFELRTRAAEIQSELEETKAAYIETMGLQAPVEYWNGKARSHSAEETRARKRLYIYFPLAFALIVVFFGGSSAWLLLHPPSTNLPALYFVLSAGLATVAGMIFWVGRLLTKLYLSEHHLRIDAEERAVMTTTYLALIRDRAATDADRQLILAALFRSSPDGIVKEDGPPELTLPMLMSRLGIPAR